MATIGIKPYVKEWIERSIGVQILKETSLLSKEQKDTVKRMMSAKKFTNMVNELPTHWTTGELERIGKEVFGNTCFTRCLVFHPKTEMAMVDAVFVLMAAEPTPSV